VTVYEWEELRLLSLARQFPQIDGRDPDAVVEAVRRIGPIQSQTARSPYAALGARLPGVTHEAVTAAYESFGIVRGSTIRGTVHTSTAAQHALLDATTRVGQRALWNRLLKLDHTPLEDVWAGVEEFARDEWRTPGELAEHLRGWLVARGEEDSVALLDQQTGRYLTFGHGGLLRRPLNGRWSGQGAAGYRSASAVAQTCDVVDDPLLEVVRLHLASYGPASRHDVAWWAGLGLRQVDDLLARLDPVWREGPDGRAYADLPGATASHDVSGVRLLPEFDAVLCGYDPKARDRFVRPGDHERLWHRKNGYMLAPVLVDGQVGGFWRIEGAVKAKELVVTSFAGSRRPTRTELAEGAAALATALGVTFTSATASSV
jgi:Winged helix DNA-binding domain